MYSCLQRASTSLVSKLHLIYKAMQCEAYFLFNIKVRGFRPKNADVSYTRKISKSNSVCRPLLSQKLIRNISQYTHE